MTPRLRYFYTREAKSGHYHVKDRQLHDMVIATCYFREAAALVQTALNQSLIKETQVEHPRPARWGDICYGAPFSIWFTGDPDWRAQPPPRS